MRSLEGAIRHSLLSNVKFDLEEHFDYATIPFQLSLLFPTSIFDCPEVCFAISPMCSDRFRTSIHEKRSPGEN